ncbi:MAG: ADOP family duplicated permease [Terracidiphilus sp.]
MAIFRRIGNLFHRAEVNREIDAELQAHIDMRIEENKARGMSREEARRDALQRFGNPTATREHVLSADAALGLDLLWNDVRYAARQLSKSPGFTVTAVLTLSIGIGLNTSIFSSMDAVVLHPLAVPAMDRVVTIAEQDRSGYHAVALANYEDWVRHSRSFEEFSVRNETAMTLTGAGDAAQVQIARSSAGFFSVLRIRAVLGRVFVDDECREGRDHVALLNYGFWQRHFAADPAVIGRTIELNERVYTIVGVLPKSVQYPSLADIFVPFAPTPAERGNRIDRDYFVLARLRDGISVKQAQSEMHILAGHLAEAYPATNQGWGAHVEPLLDGINGDYTPLYYRLVMGATLFVLLIVCANIANLQFARGIDHRPQIAMRVALGAKRTRIVRQVLIETMLLALAGAAAGLVLAKLNLQVMGAYMPPRVARFMAGWDNVSLNGRAFLFSVGAALAAGIVSGIAPALDALRINVADQLKAGSRASTGAAGAHRLRGAFAVAQVSLAVALVIGAALLSKGMLWMLHRPDVYAPKTILTFNVSLPPTRYDTPRKQAAWYNDSLAKLRALPGVTHANVATALPYNDNAWLVECAIESRPTLPGKTQSALHLPVSPGYFSQFHIPIVAGRGFTASDTPDTLPVAVVSRRFVTQYFPSENPIGHRVRLGGNTVHEPWLTIVGVADEVSYGLWDQTPRAAVYMDAAQVPSPGTEYAMTTTGDPLALAPAARKALVSIDPALPINTVETYQQLENDNLTGLMYASFMLAMDAVIALLLSAIGIFGVMANLVGERTREIGVRLAMGARREDVLRMILARASRLTAVGLGVGLVLTYGLTRLVANLLVGVRPDDPVVFIGITVAIAGIALGSSWIPARRASRVDPMQALRSE